jgi:hypothetical protein
MQTYCILFNIIYLDFYTFFITKLHAYTKIEIVLIFFNIIIISLIVLFIP